MAKEKHVFEKAEFFQSTPGSIETLDRLVNTEIEKHSERSMLAKAAIKTYGVIKEIAKPALIGAVVNGLSTQTYEGVLEGAKQGAMVVAPLVAIINLGYYMKSEEEKKNKIKRNNQGKIYIHDNPVKMTGLVAAFMAGGYVLSAVAIDFVAGTNLSYIAAAKIGGVQGAYDTIRYAFKGKKVKEQINQEIALKENKFNQFTGSYRSTV